MTLHHTRPAGHGFTLIELVVAMGIFAVMLLIVAGAFSRFVSTQRADVGEQELQEDMRVALEFFNREVRTAYGTTFETGTVDVDGTDQPFVSLRNQNGACVMYRRSAAGELERAMVAVDAGKSCSDPFHYIPTTVGGVEPFSPLTGEAVVIESLVFDVQAALQDPAGNLVNQGLITVRLAVRPRMQARVVRLQNTTTARQMVGFTL